MGLGLGSLKGYRGLLGFFGLCLEIDQSVKIVALKTINGQNSHYHLECRVGSFGGVSGAGIGVCNYGVHVQAKVRLLEYDFVSGVYGCQVLQIV